MSRNRNQDRDRDRDRDFGRSPSYPSVNDDRNGQSWRAGQSGAPSTNGGADRWMDHGSDQNFERADFNRDRSREMSQFERGRKASRDYDTNYTGYRSSMDDGEYGSYGRDLDSGALNPDRDMNRDDRYSDMSMSVNRGSRYDAGRDGANDFNRGSDYGRSPYEGRKAGYGNTGYGANSYGQDSNEHMPGYGSAPSNFGSGRWSGYGAGDSGFEQTSAIGKGPKNWKRTDERIKDDVSHCLERDHYVDASEIEVKVQDGVVTLSGHVKNRPTKRRSEDIIENLPGVRDVRNELTVDQSLFQQAKEAIMGTPETDPKMAASMSKPRH